jgi:3-methyladenine DNA glycosylase/8-oxoguanine DNA glycosylase
MVAVSRTPVDRALGFDKEAAIAHLSDRDAKLGALIAKVGPLALVTEETRSTFEALAKAIVYQQLHGKAAATIFARVGALHPRGRLRPESLLALEETALRGAGLSRNKMLALRDLATRTLAGTVPDVPRLHAMSDEDIVEQLAAVRGIGRWTVQMLLIFRLGRPDVLPVDDFGVRHGFNLAYRKRALPTPKELARYGERWRPYRTVASWYLWRAVDLAKAAPP